MAIHSKRQQGREYTVVLERGNGERAAFKAYSARSVTLYRQPSFSGAMRKHAGWRHDRTDPERAALDACAHIPVVYGATILRRRKAQ